MLSVLTRLNRKCKRRRVVAVAVVNGVIHPLRRLCCSRAQLVVLGIGHEETQFIFINKCVDGAGHNFRALDVQDAGLVIDVCNQADLFSLALDPRQIFLRVLLRRLICGSQDILRVGFEGGPVFRQSQRPCFAERDRAVEVKFPLRRCILIADGIVGHNNVVQRTLGDAGRSQID